MYHSFASFHNWAFPKPTSVDGLSDGGFETAPYSKGLRTDGIAVTKYTMGDTRYQPEQAIVKSHLTTPPSKVSKRYSPQTLEQNSGFPLPPEPTFMKSNNNEKITTIRELMDASRVDDSPKTDSVNTPLPGIDFARTHADAAALLERLGMPVTKEAHYSAVISKAVRTDKASVINEESGQQALIDMKSVEPIIVDRTPTQFIAPAHITTKQIVVNNVPDKNYDNLNMVPIGMDANITQINTSIRKPQTLEQANQKITQSRNLINVVEKLSQQNDIHEIESIEDVHEVLRTVAEDFVSLKESQKAEQQKQMEVVEHRISKTVQPEQTDADLEEPIREIKLLIKEVVESHPDLMQRNLNSPDMEFSLAARDVFLRSQIERELRDKFEHNLRENNKVMEKKVALIFEEMVQKFINP